MFASLLDVEAETLTKMAWPAAPDRLPGGNPSDIVNAPANRFRHRIVDAGDSIVTIAAASPEH
jgi:hypothetical protein